MNKEINYKGKVYESIKVLAQELDVPVETLRSRKKKGWPQERWTEKKQTNENEQLPLAYCF